MSRTSDVIVLGLGAMGSAIAGALAEQGRRVIAFDAFTPPHTQGSSHGHSRIYRQAYWEDPRYVHLLLRARELWEKLERESGHELLRMTGGLMLGPQSGRLVHRSAESARQFGLPHEILSAGDLRSRWPIFQIGDDTIGLLEQNAGYLDPEPCIRQQIAQATRVGAELHCDEPVLDFRTAAGSVTVRTARATYSAGHLVVAAGPWAPQLLADLTLPLRVIRQVVFWFEPIVPLDAFYPERLPVYLFETAPDELILYGFPLTGPDGEGVKIGIHDIDEGCTPETVERAIRPSDEALIRRRLAASLPALNGRLVHAETCLYTMTPDEHFILGAHPHDAAITLALGFSGHGFKFAPVVGEAIAELVVHGHTRHDLGMFSPDRFLR